MKRAFSMMLALLLLLMAGKTSVSANSGPGQWTGTKTNGVIVTGENCPIVVEHEDLIFDIPEFPQEYYHSSEDYRMYSGKVTAEYTFCNPAEYEISATLVFPFGMAPTYAYYDHKAPEAQHDWLKYGVSVDGQPIEVTVRHTLARYGHNFDMEEDLDLLHDSFMEDPFYRPDLQVTKYVWQVSGVELEKNLSVYAGIDLSGDPTRTKTYLVNSHGGNTHEGFIRVGTHLERNSENDGTMVLYVIGESLEEVPEWVLSHMGQEIPGTVELIHTENMTLYDMIMVDYDPGLGILEHDWYNALITSMNQSEWSYGYVGPDFDGNGDFNVSRNLMRWYEYDLVFQPGQRIVNAVTAPLYPDIEMTTEPYTYGYTYLLSPAVLWADFGTLDITVNTSFYMIESTNTDFLWNNPGYSAHLDGLPEGELKFVLCQEQNPVSNRKTAQQILDANAGEILIHLARAIGAAVLVMILWNIWQRKNTE